VCYQLFLQRSRASRNAATRDSPAGPSAAFGNITVAVSTFSLSWQQFRSASRHSTLPACFCSHAFRPVSPLAAPRRSLRRMMLVKSGNIGLQHRPVPAHHASAPARNKSPPRPASSRGAEHRISFVSRKTHYPSSHYDTPNPRRHHTSSRAPHLPLAPDSVRPKVQGNQVFRQIRSPRFSPPRLGVDSVVQIVASDVSIAGVPVAS